MPETLFYEFLAEVDDNTFIIDAAFVIDNRNCRGGGERQRGILLKVGRSEVYIYINGRPVSVNGNIISPISPTH